MGIYFSRKGFQCTIQDKTYEINWLQITDIVAYKVDLMTYDTVRIDIRYSDKILTIDEESENWARLCARLDVLFPMIDKKWLEKVSRHAFKTNHTMLYQNSYSKVYSDFMNSDDDGRIRLNTSGAIADLENLKDNLQENIWILLTDQEGLAVYGFTNFSIKENIWVAEINPEGFIEI